MVNIVEGIIIPIVTTVIGGSILLGFIFFVVKGFRNAWRKSAKFSLKYGLLRKKYPDEVVTWCSDCVRKGIGYYDAKKLMMVKMMPDEKINETLWIFDKLINELNKENKRKGGVKYGREFERGNSKIEGTTEFPQI
jgi:hypothetical protein